jgi:hypothetical protein
MICFFLLVLFAGTTVCSAQPVDTLVEGIQVQVVAATAPSTKVIRRMSESVKTIGEHLLLGRSIIEVSGRREYYELLFRDVFDRVLVGYTVEKVEIEPAKIAKIRLSVVPWGDTVRNVSIRVNYSGIAPEAIALVKQDMGKLEAEIEAALIGLPIDAVDWATGVARELIREILRRQLPEFHFSLDVEAGRDTMVRLSLIPTGSVVREAKVSLRSQTIPNLLLVHARPEIETQARSLRGLPVAYVERHLAYFTDRIRETTLSDSVIRQFALNVTPKVIPGSDTEILVAVETDRFRITAEVFLDTGRERDNISAKAHVGQMIGRKDEIFVELKVLPGMMSWEVMPGWGHQFASDTWAGFRYRTNDREWTAWLEQKLGNRWTLRAERWPNLNYNEIGIRYKLHDFLSAEFVLTNDRSWLRMVGHL